MMINVLLWCATLGMSPECVDCFWGYDDRYATCASDYTECDPGEEECCAEEQDDCVECCNDTHYFQAGCCDESCEGRLKGLCLLEAADDWTACLMSCAERYDGCMDM